MSRLVIIGGMGPQASLELHRRIIAAAARAGAVDNQDYPEIVHASIPIADFISSGDSSQGLQALQRSLDDLHFRPDDQIVLACNTVHLLLPELEARYGLKFLSLVDLTIAAIQQTGVKRVGLLASPTTITSGLYTEPLRVLGYEIVLPTAAEIDGIEQAIRHVIANSPPDIACRAVNPVIERLLADGAEQVILGCTELSVMYAGSSVDRLVDPLQLVCHRLFD